MKKDEQKRQALSDDPSAASNQPAGQDCPVVVVGIGTSAGGLKSLKRFFTKIPSGLGVAFVLIQHLDPSQENLTLELLRDQTVLAVVEATEGMPVLAERIHVIPPDKFLSVGGSRLTLQEPVYCNGLRMPIDHFFCSLAADQGRRGCGIVLSGAGSDGTLGLSEIKATGGKTLVEDPGSAEFPSMPQNAIQAGVVDAVLPAEAMAQAIMALVDQVRKETLNQPVESPEFDADLQAVLEILRARVGHDFRCYKPNTLVRRIRRRMALAKMTTYADYARFLKEHPDEVSLLQNDLLIGVTEFFRQPQAWKVLEEKVIAPLVERAQAGEEIRVWVPGCSTGKEAYSLAMVLTEQIAKSRKKVELQIFGTDSDSASLATARSGSYSKGEVVETIPSERLRRFFTRKNGGYQIIKEVREKVVFAPQNITADPPFSRLDLISCRNLLIYLDQAVQRRIIALFHFALREGGTLFLGTAETVGDREDLFEALSKKWRIYRRIGIGRPVGVEIPAYSAEVPRPAPGKLPAAPVWHDLGPARSPRLSLTSAAQQMLLDRFAPACVMIDRNLHVVYTHGSVEDYLTFPKGELTTRVVDMAREGLQTRLRGVIEKCLKTNRSVSLTARVKRAGKSIPIRTMVSPLRYPRETEGMLLIAFEDYRIPTVNSRSKTAGETSSPQLEDELRVTREELQSTIEQLENSNDQLKASNEEVTAANEELQAANEEMETSKEELQSLNEELNTINNRLQEKVEELGDTNNDLSNLLSSTNIATVFLDKDLKVKRYTPASTRLFSLIPSDVGRPMGDILRRFSDEALLEDARRVLADLTPLSREVQAEDSRWYIRRITPYRTQDDRIEGVVITFTDVCDLKETEEALRRHQVEFEGARAEAENQKRRLAVIVDSIADGFFAVDREWRITHVNDPALRHFGKTREEMVGRGLFDVFPAARGTLYETEYRRAMESGNPAHFETRSTGSDRMMELHAYPGPDNMTVLFRDITERSRMAADLREAQKRAEWLARFPEENPNPVMRVSVDGIILYCNPATARIAGWTCEVGRAVAGPLLPLVRRAMAEGKEMQEDVQLGEIIYFVWATPFPVEHYANVYGRDITDRKQAEEALRESEARLKRSQEIAHLGSWELDLPKNQLTWSDEVYRIFGLEPQEFGATYEAFLERVHPDDRAAVDSAYSSSLQEGRSSYEIEHRIVKKSTGKIRWVHEKCQHITDAAGRIVRSLGMILDITDIKRAEESLQRNDARSTLLSETAGQLLASDDPQGIANELCRKVMEHLDCQVFFNFLADDKAGRLHLNAYAGIPEEEAHKIEWLDYGVAVCGCVAQERRRIIAEKIGSVPDPRTNLVKSYGVQAYACHPLMVQDLLIGTLSFGTKTRTNFSLEDLAVMRTVTDQVATAMERVRLIKELRKSRDELEKRVRERTNDLAKANESLRQLSEKLISSQEEERKRIAGDIHDSLGACLSTIKFKVQDVFDRTGETDSVLAESLKPLLPVIQDGIEECRRIQMDLRPSLLDDLGLLATFSWFLRRFQTIYSKIQVEQEILIEEEDISRLLKVVIFRVTQEAMNNIAKHSKANLARLSLRKENDRIELRVEDNGRGFNPERALGLESAKRGLGLSSMKERVEFSGGSFQIESTEGRGTTIRVSWPIPS